MTQQRFCRGCFKLRIFSAVALLIVIYEGLVERVLDELPAHWAFHTIAITLSAAAAAFAAQHLRDGAMRRARRAAEAVEMRASSFQKTLLDAMPVAVFYKDREGRYLGCNELFAEVMGVSSEQIKGRTVAELWPSEHADTYHQKDLALMANPVTQQYEFQIKDKHGQIRDVIYGKGAFFDEHGQVAGIIGAFFDITDKKRLEQELLCHRTQLEAMVEQKTAELRQRNLELGNARDAADAATRAKDAFLQTMSHELRTPLNGVLGAAHILRLRLDDPGQLRFVDMVIASGRSLLQVIERILVFSKLSAETGGGLAAIELATFLPGLIEPLCPVAEARGGALAVSVDEALPACIYEDHARLGVILRHFLDNGLKFSGRGTVRLSARPDTLPGGEAVIRFEVVDQGIGIEADKLGMIFEAFSQADGSLTRQHGGIGLGLAECRQLARLMGGEVGVSSTPGEGSAFFLTLPLRGVPA